MTSRSQYTCLWCLQGLRKFTGKSKPFKNITGILCLATQYLWLFCAFYSVWGQDLWTVTICCILYIHIYYIFILIYEYLYLYLWVRKYSTEFYVNHHHSFNDFFKPLNIFALVADPSTNSFWIIIIIYFFCCCQIIYCSPVVLFLSKSRLAFSSNLFMLYSVKQKTIWK